MPEKKKKGRSILPFVLIGGIVLAAVILAAVLLRQNDATTSQGTDDVTQNSMANQDEWNTNAGAEKGQIALLLSSRDESEIEIEEGAMAASEDVGYQLLSYDAENDSTQQMQQIEDAVAQGVEAILVDLIDADAASSAVNAAGNIPIVFVNHPPSDLHILDEEQVAFCGSNDDTIGYMQGQYLADFCHTKGMSEIRYILLRGELEQLSSVQYSDSVFQALKDNGINAIFVAGLTNNYDRAQVKNKMMPLVTADTPFDCIIASHDAMALGAIDACEQAGIDPSTFPILGMGGTIDGAQAVRDGKLTMTFFKNFEGIGKGAVQAAINLINGDAANVYTSYDADASGESYSDSIVWVPYQRVIANNVISYLNRE